MPQLSPRKVQVQTPGSAHTPGRTTPVTPRKSPIRTEESKVSAAHVPKPKLTPRKVPGEFRVPDAPTPRKARHVPGSPASASIRSVDPSTPRQREAPLSAVSTQASNARDDVRVCMCALVPVPASG
jgi:hypothetical protein